MAPQPTPTETADIEYVPLTPNPLDEAVVETLATLIARLLGRAATESDLPVIV